MLCLKVFRSSNGDTDMTFPKTLSAVFFAITFLMSSHTIAADADSECSFRILTITLSNSSTDRTYPSVLKRLRGDAPDCFIEEPIDQCASIETESDLLNEIKETWIKSPTCSRDRLDTLFENLLSQEPLVQASLKDMMKAAFESHELPSFEHILIRTRSDGHEEPVLSQLFKPSRFTLSIARRHKTDTALTLLNRFEGGLTGGSDSEQNNRASVAVEMAPTGDLVAPADTNLAVLINPDSEKTYWRDELAHLGKETQVEGIFFVLSGNNRDEVMDAMAEVLPRFQLQGESSDTGKLARPFSKLEGAATHSLYRDVLFFRRTVMLDLSDIQQRMSQLQ
ncbi:hypothetical protein [Parendozoicomonas haliclonae]|uniref:Uncharacterized protein n=1 Tax=Parendozoicomonas haliclonae TaxID=1960125 RepID=A0A1X7AF37_9GAMM|nr:hypothetical protein [Parendozoicomonas haliclonae]SMA35060.1 hypothetical protein EHSB41UT_00487 [Parendozoicomonas haliclonae]